MHITKFPYEIVDLTHTLDQNIPSWDGQCGFHCEVQLDYSECSSAVKFRVQQLKMNAGIGTHMDAPAHCIAGGVTIDQLSLSELMVPCVVIDVSDVSHELYSVSLQDIQRYEDAYDLINAGDFVMIRTGWEKFWQDPEKYHNAHRFPSVSAQAAELLLSRKVVGIGIDTLSPDRPTEGFPVHQLFLSQGKYIVENAANLEKLPPRGSFIMALPIKVKGGTEAPIRLIGLINSSRSG